jgi:hypothetical protein
METPEHKPSILLPALGLLGAVTMRMVVELFAPRPKNVPAPEPQQKHPSGTTLRPGDTSGPLQNAATASTRQQRVRERAFWIWIEEGRPLGRDEEHWRKAEAEIPK